MQNRNVFRIPKEPFCVPEQGAGETPEFHIIIVKAPLNLPCTTFSSDRGGFFFCFAKKKSKLKKQDSLQ